MLGALVIGGLTFISLGLNTSIVFAICTEGIAGIAAFFSVHNISLCQIISLVGLIGILLPYFKFMDEVEVEKNIAL